MDAQWIAVCDAMLCDVGVLVVFFIEPESKRTPLWKWKKKVE